MFAKDKLDLFFGKVDINGKNGCWKWIGYKDKNGYGSIKVNQKQYRAHRFSWMIHYGKIPRGALVCHKCDNPECTNPDHLFIGSPADNSSDMVTKNRSAKPEGEENSNSVLTNDQVNQIRIMLLNGETAVNIAKKFKISDGTVHNINYGGWSHVKMSDGTVFKKSKPKKTKRLSVTEVEEIKLILATTERFFPDIASQFGVNRMTIERIAIGDTWSNLKIKLPNGEDYSFDNRSYKRTKISEDQVKDIKEMIYNGNVSYSDIAKHYPVSKSNIYQIAKGQSWKDTYIILKNGSKWYNLTTPPNTQTKKTT